MISLIWGVNGIHHLLALPKRAKYHPAYFAKTVLPDPRTKICNSGRRETLKGILSHLDRAPAHNSQRSLEVVEKTLAHRVPHPADSLGLAPSDFFPFGMLKELLKGNATSDRHEFLSHQ
jgi:hypothetical protein